MAEPHFFLILMHTCTVNSIMCVLKSIFHGSYFGVFYRDMTQY